MSDEQLNKEIDELSAQVNQRIDALNALWDKIEEEAGNFRESLEEKFNLPALEEELEQISAALRQAQLKHSKYRGLDDYLDNPHDSVKALMSEASEAIDKALRLKKLFPDVHPVLKLQGVNHHLGGWGRYLWPGEASAVKFNPDRWYPSHKTDPAF